MIIIIEFKNKSIIPPEFLTTQLGGYNYGQNDNFESKIAATPSFIIGKQNLNIISCINTQIN